MSRSQYLAFYAKNMSAQYLEKILSGSNGTLYEDWSYTVNDIYKF